MTREWASRLVTVLACLMTLPALAFAQSNSSIAGVAKDTSGAVLPGVTVEASSPSLIEKTRTAVTDGAGQYKIVNLVPGIYAVSFSLTGFNTVKQEGIVLTSSFTSTVNADMRVGSRAHPRRVHRPQPAERQPQRRIEITRPHLGDDGEAVV